MSVSGKTRGAALSIGGLLALLLLSGASREAKAAPPESSGGGGGGGGPPELSPVAKLYLAIGDPRPGDRLLMITSPYTKGDDVRNWQVGMQLFRPSALPTHGADGTFGPETEAATRQFQRDANAFYSRVGIPEHLEVDGKLGPRTRTAWARRTYERRSAPAAPAALRGDSPLPGVIPMMTPDAQPSDERRVASAMVRNLLSSRPETEDRRLVERFQILRRLKPSGYYNPETAYSLIELGFVPPTPYYWGKGGVRAKKRRYQDRLEAEALRDPVRAPEWRGARKMVM